MLRRHATEITAGPPASGPDQADARWVEPYAEAVGAYVARICGPDGTQALTRRALAEIARCGDAGLPPAGAATVVRTGARTVALGELERAARRPGVRAARLFSRHWRCAATPTRLRERAAGELSTKGLRDLYGHLDRCERCAAVAGRCDSAEWYLASDLTGPGPVSNDAPTLPAPDALAGAPPAAVASRRTPSSVRRGFALVASVALLGVLAVVVSAARGGGGRPALRVRAHGVVALPPARAVPPARTAPAGGAVRGLRDPFVLAGAKFAVFRNPTQGWTGFLRTDPGAGQRWMAITVRVRNLTRTGFDPLVLDYRLVDGAGAAYVPVASLGNVPAPGLAPRPLAAGQLVEAHLGFRIPAQATGLQLRFGPRRARPIIVSLGP